MLSFWGINLCWAGPENYKLIFSPFLRRNCFEFSTITEIGITAGLCNPWRMFLVIFSHGFPQTLFYFIICICYQYTSEDLRGCSQICRASSTTVFYYSCLWWLLWLSWTISFICSTEGDSWAMCRSPLSSRHGNSAHAIL